MKCDFKVVVLLVEWSSFWGGLKAGFYNLTTPSNINQTTGVTLQTFLTTPSNINQITGVTLQTLNSANCCLTGFFFALPDWLIPGMLIPCAAMLANND